MALYRKYRPASFAEVMGQAHVTDPLRQALSNGRISHAYLFSGPRGCGKTSSARIMARSLNCEQGPTPDPCGECGSCVALAPNGPGSLDVIEIDAASHNGVDDARDLRERAFFAPVSSRYKVYIIDEAHMVTTAAFNALLKLVEEPPEFVKFVFATTEPENVLQTIRSRTHHYPFRLMSPKALTELLTRVAESEGIAVDSTVIPLVVRAAAGSARDGLSILDQVLASAGPDGVTREGAAALLGVTPDSLLDGIVDAFAAHDAAAVFGLLDQVMEGGHDPRRFATDVLERLRDLIVLDAVPDAGSTGLLDCPDDQLERMGRQAVAMGTAGLSRAADLFHAGLVEMRGKTTPRLLLELVCARVLLPAASADDSALLARLERLERRLDIAGAGPAPDRPTGPPPVPPSRPTRPAVTEAAGGPARTEVDAVRGDAPLPPPTQEAPPEAPAAQAWPTTAELGRTPSDPSPAPAATSARPDAHPAAAEPTPAPPSAPGSIDAAALRSAWDTVLGEVKSRKRASHALLADATVASVEGRTLVLAFQHAPLLRQFQGSVGPDVLREALQATLGVDLDLRCVLHDSLAPHDRGARPDRRPEHAPPPPAEETGFAPGDEAEPEDPDAPPPPQEPRGEDAALRLVETELGGKVMSTSGDD
ncbi:MAG: DNA polymerase III subunit gamma and tau [Frankiales bacterium]|nr:MAG: DNA polymerase III subunit gamma and tau [Frankiales bacterium]